jgi:hypothetical protein
MTEQNNGTLYCANHPTRATYLRCNRCEKPICTECAVHTPTGYRCKDCVRSQQKIFDTARPLDYVAAFFIPIILSFLGSLLINMVGFFIFLVAPGVGWIIAEGVRKATGRRRSKPMFLVAAGASVIGGLPSVLPILILALLGSAGLSVLIGLVWPVLYTAIVATTVYTRLSGIQISR